MRVGGEELEEDLGVWVGVLYYFSCLSLICIWGVLYIRVGDFRTWGFGEGKSGFPVGGM